MSQSKINEMYEESYEIYLEEMLKAYCEEKKYTESHARSSAKNREDFLQWLRKEEEEYSFEDWYSDKYTKYKD